jgi:hypothetical protein
MCIRRYTQIYADIRTYACIRRQAHMCSMNTRSLLHIYAHIRTYTHIYAHMCSMNTRSLLHICMLILGLFYTHSFIRRQASIMCCINQSTKWYWTIHINQSTNWYWTIHYAYTHAWHQYVHAHICARPHMCTPTYVHAHICACIHMCCIRTVEGHTCVM